MLFGFRIGTVFSFRRRRPGQNLWTGDNMNQSAVLKRTTMNFKARSVRSIAVAIVGIAVPAHGFAAESMEFNTVPAFPLSNTAMHIQQTVKQNLPFTVTGSTGAILGLQNG